MTPPPAEVEIVKRPDGSPWQLGSGGFGTVYKALRNGVQPVAVKMLSVRFGGHLRSILGAQGLLPGMGSVCAVLGKAEVAFSSSMPE